jgi:hypothetical protein
MGATESAASRSASPLKLRVCQSQRPGTIWRWSCLMGWWRAALPPKRANLPAPVASPARAGLFCGARLGPGAGIQDSLVHFDRHIRSTHLRRIGRDAWCPCAICRTQAASPYTAALGVIPPSRIKRRGRTGCLSSALILRAKRFRRWRGRRTSPGDDGPRTQARQSRGTSWPRSRAPAPPSW